MKHLWKRVALNHRAPNQLLFYKTNALNWLKVWLNGCRAPSIHNAHSTHIDIILFFIWFLFCALEIDASLSHRVERIQNCIFCTVKAFRSDFFRTLLLWLLLLLSLVCRCCCCFKYSSRIACSAYSLLIHTLLLPISNPKPKYSTYKWSTHKTFLFFPIHKWCSMLCVLFFLFCSFMHINNKRISVSHLYEPAVSRYSLGTCDILIAARLYTMRQRKP